MSILPYWPTLICWPINRFMGQAHPWRINRNRSSKRLYHIFGTSLSPQQIFLVHSRSQFYQHLWRFAMTWDRYAGSGFETTESKCCFQPSAPRAICSGMTSGRVLIHPFFALSMLPASKFSRAHASWTTYMCFGNRPVIVENLVHFWNDPTWKSLPCSLDLSHLRIFFTMGRRFMFGRQVRGNVGAIQPLHIFESLPVAYPWKYVFVPLSQRFKAVWK